MGNELVTPSNRSEILLLLFVRFFGFVSPFWLLKIFERATHRGPIFVGGNRDVEIEIFERPCAHSTTTLLDPMG